jgi:hypothetical protein
MKGEVKKEDREEAGRGSSLILLRPEIKEATKIRRESERP